MSNTDKGFEKLRNAVRTNYYDKRFPQSFLSLHNLERHIQIYQLINEYLELRADMDVVKTGSAKGFINKRLSEIEEELFRFWIATDDEMIPQKHE